MANTITDVVELQQLLFNQLKENLETWEQSPFPLKESDALIQGIAQQLAEIVCMIYDEFDVNKIAFDKIVFELDRINKRLDSIEETLGLDDPVFIRG